MATGFTQSQMLEVRETFDLFDKDNNGKISTEDLPTLIRSMGQNPTQSELEIVTKEADKEGEGYVSFDDFVDAAAAYARKDPEGDLTKALKVLDTEDTGYVDAKDLYESLGSMGDKLSDEEKKDLEDTATDINKDGKIEISEFVKLMTSGAN